MALGPSHLCTLHSNLPIMPAIPAPLRSTRKHTFPSSTGGGILTKSSSPFLMIHGITSTNWGIRCAGNSLEIWCSLVGSELNCTLKCNDYKNCSKYLFQIYQDSVQGIDCWIWSYNRSDHSCGAFEDYYDFNVGI